MNLKKVDLNAPAFGPGSQNIETETEEAEAQPVKVEKEEETEETSEEESKVPYSRFKKFHDEAKSAREEAEFWKKEAESNKKETVTTEEVPEFWKELYGDSEASQKAWRIQEKANDSLIERSRREAIEAVRNERYEESKQVEENVDKIDSNFDNLSDTLGRELTEKEQSTLLDIVDDYTPKDGDGNYIGEIMPFNKAWEIYELKQQAGKLSKAKSRDSIASLSNTQSQGDPAVIEEKNKQFNPLDWNSYKRFI